MLSACAISMTAKTRSSSRPWSSAASASSSWTTPRSASRRATPARPRASAGREPARSRDRRSTPARAPRRRPPPVPRTARPTSGAGRRRSGVEPWSPMTRARRPAGRPGRCLPPRARRRDPTGTRPGDDWPPASDRERVRRRAPRAPRDQGDGALVLADGRRGIGGPLEHLGAIHPGDRPGIADTGPQLEDPLELGVDLRVGGQVGRLFRRPDRRRQGPGRVVGPVPVVGDLRLTGSAAAARAPAPRGSRPVGRGASSARPAGARRTGLPARARAGIRRLVRRRHRSRTRSARRPRA